MRGAVLPLPRTSTWCGHLPYCWLLRVSGCPGLRSDAAAANITLTLYPYERKNFPVLLHCTSSGHGSRWELYPPTISS